MPVLIAIVIASGMTGCDKNNIVSIREKAEMGDLKAQDALGKKLCSGEGVVINFREAIIWFRKAAERGYKPAQAHLGRLYMYGLGIEQDEAEGLKWIRLAAENGDSDGQRYLGYAYRDGMGVAKDENSAQEWFRRSLNGLLLVAERGDVEAQANLGYMYLNLCIPRNEKEAFKWSKNAAEHDVVSAQTDLADMYLEGRGIQKNEKEALKWYRIAAAQADAIAIYKLGCAYYNGQGITKNADEALKWFRKAAEQGLEIAQYRLGHAYDYGDGVPMDHKEAIKWYRKAAEQNYPNAENNLGQMYEYGRGVTRNETEAVKWYHKAALHGLACAQKNLGVMYEEGRGVAKDVVEAAKWFGKADDQDAANISILELSEDQKTVIEIARCLKLKQQLSSQNLKYIIGLSTIYANDISSYNVELQKQKDNIDSTVNFIYDAKLRESSKVSLQARTSKIVAPNEFNPKYLVDGKKRFEMLANVLIDRCMKRYYVLGTFQQYDGNSQKAVFNLEKVNGFHFNSNLLHYGESAVSYSRLLTNDNFNVSWLYHDINFEPNNLLIFNIPITIMDTVYRTSDNNFTQVINDEAARKYDENVKNRDAFLMANGVKPITRNELSEGPQKEKVREDAIKFVRRNSIWLIAKGDPVTLNLSEVHLVVSGVDTPFISLKQ